MLLSLTFDLLGSENSQTEIADNVVFVKTVLTVASVHKTQLKAVLSPTVVLITQTHLHIPLTAACDKLLHTHSDELTGNLIYNCVS